MSTIEHDFQQIEEKKAWGQEFVVSVEINDDL